MTSWTVALQVPLSVGSSRQEYWSGLPFPSPGDLPDPGIKPRSPALEGEFVTTGPPGKPLLWGIFFQACLRKKMLLACMLSHVRIFYDPRTVALQVPLSVGFPRQEYRSGLPFPSPGDLPDPGIEPVSLAYPALAGRFFTSESPGKPLVDGFQIPNS